MKYAKVAAVAAGTLMAVGSAAPAFADSGASGAAVGSPGVISGDTIQVPIAIPINLCGNTIDIIGLLNPAFGNNCLNT
ncbi:chaplin [Streptomyces sp. x-80]|uniref:chaplin n=1 Tax=Streptomyces sp. x-80 TaxID=2789282 RepID=UPI00397EDE13